MSWMDSWSRPSKSQAAPPPFYLTQGDAAKYCHTCGRIIGARRANSSKASSTEVKYCSDRCKRNKPSAEDRRIDSALLALLLGKDPHESETGHDGEITIPKPERKGAKGDPRIIVQMSDIETAVFGDMKDPDKVYGRNKNRAKRGLPDPAEWQSVDMTDAVDREKSEPLEADASIEDSMSVEGVRIPIQHHIRPSQADSDVNGSIGGEKGWSEKIEETPEMLQKRLEGQKKAENREQVRNAARRAIAFGLLVDNVEAQPKQKRKGGDHAPEQVLKKCEALMNNAVVEPSFAKGDWSIRWRED